MSTVHSPQSTVRPPLRSAPEPEMVRSSLTEFLIQPYFSSFIYYLLSTGPVHPPSFLSGIKSRQVKKKKASKFQASK
ncbi:hypothetical protein BO70DRAFT_13606 [Aspergillus heteromorphus CBS 117.55]|uniref:Uncharacterized protein n=1 Tax=Aspergillus heteromorphus CBS 117.55 TaxID=1448321 RepID=A0A317X2H6_9EURO|nr:uncharacterized protein BO70DRAFT_13606 [Aspergillus heteromorphus CBS 117.55]PWY92555.1 hypothetical protein BO70DRAFT_13606 [Aspergillus heteromorphus CBS 117.55]